VCTRGTDALSTLGPRWITMAEREVASAGLTSFSSTTGEFCGL
jgi:hypothetical protein